MLKLYKYLLKYWWAYIIIVVCIIANMYLRYQGPELTKKLVNEVIVNRNVELLSTILLGFAFIGFSRAIIEYVCQILTDVSSSSVATKLRTDLFERTQKLSANYFDKNNAGEIMSRIKSDVDKVWDCLGFISMLTLQMIVMIIIVVYSMAKMNWQMAIVPTVLMIIASFIAVKMEQKLDAIYDEIDDADSDLNDAASENLAGVRTVKSFAREKFEMAKFYTLNRKYYELNLKQSKTLVNYYPFFQFVSLIIPMIVLVHGGFVVLSGKMNLGELAAYIQYSISLTWPMDMAGWLVNGISYGIASWKRIKKLYAEPIEIKSIQNPVVLSKVNGDITFSNVSFEHEGHKILRNVSFTVPQGTTLGIMGATGSGKTTLINLLTRIYDVTEGEIRLDGANIRTLTTDQLRSNISVVAQDVFLFSNTVGENLRFGGNGKVTDNILQQSIKDAEALFVNNLPDKVNTVIGERGMGLSGGQKQRLTIARALAKKRPVIVFDDSTSALDMETERELQKTINKMTDVTKLIIAHRISSVRHADNIIVLDGGKIAESGTHEQLLSKKGLYYQTYMAQYGDYLQGVN